MNNFRRIDQFVEFETDILPRKKDITLEKTAARREKIEGKYHKAVYHHPWVVTS